MAEHSVILRKKLKSIESRIKVGPRVHNYDPNYKSLVDVFIRAYERAAVGKGHAHHSHGEKFEDQCICRGARVFGLGGVLFQIGKKNEQITKMETNDQKIKELLDIINYAAAGVIVLDES